MGISNIIFENVLVNYSFTNISLVCQLDFGKIAWNYMFCFYLYSSQPIYIAEMNYVVDILANSLFSVNNFILRLIIECSKFFN